MSEETFGPDRFREAVKLLWNAGLITNNGLVCDDDDIHETLVDGGLLKQDPEADTDTDPDAYQWLSDATLTRLHTVRIQPFIVWDGGNYQP